ncbi:MAG: four helix bundle protein [FCB group bacterium]|nr:four helix bundle protein [FCB group bacterium]
MAYKLAMEIFELSKSFPKEERYSLTDQIRRSSRSVCSNIAEGYRKRIYPRHFVMKISDSDAECSETLVWLNFANDCGYLSKDLKLKLILEYKEVGRMLGGMMKNPEGFLP